VPEPGAATLEVGCGEGRVVRDLVARGHRVTGLDASPTLVSAAAQADPASRYVVGRAEALPFDDGAFELVVAYNSLMDVEDMPVAVSEAARVLAPAVGCARASRTRSRRRARGSGGRSRRVRR
jgi:ubiquinone/menaquinone biosynthesis C-methylase UbiE